MRIQLLTRVFIPALAYSQYLLSFCYQDACHALALIFANCWKIPFYTCYTPLIATLSNSFKILSEHPSLPLHCSTYASWNQALHILLHRLASLMNRLLMQPEYGSLLRKWFSNQISQLILFVSTRPAQDLEDKKFCQYLWDSLIKHFGQL